MSLSISGKKAGTVAKQYIAPVSGIGNQYPDLLTDNDVVVKLNIKENIPNSYRHDEESEEEDNEYSGMFRNIDSIGKYAQDDALSLQQDIFVDKSYNRQHLHVYEPLHSWFARFLRFSNCGVWILQAGDKVEGILMKCHPYGCVCQLYLPPIMKQTFAMTTE